MKNLYKISLEKEKTEGYFLDAIESCTVTPSILIKHLNISNGTFYTLLPNDANVDNIYNFRIGGILSQNPILPHSKGGTYMFIPSIVDELALHISKLMLNNNEMACVFDEVNVDFDPIKEKNGEYDSDFFYKKNLLYSYGKEILYIITNKSIDTKTITKTFEQTNAIWHSLCFITTADCSTLPHQLQDSHIENLCSHVQIVIVGAYDGEGYIFWEKHKSPLLG